MMDYKVFVMDNDDNEYNNRHDNDIVVDDDELRG